MDDPKGRTLFPILISAFIIFVQILSVQSVAMNKARPSGMQFNYEEPSTDSSAVVYKDVFRLVNLDSIVLPKFLSSQMVVQLDQPIRIWGKAESGALVIGSFSGNDLLSKDTVVVDSKGDFLFVFPKRNATANPCQITLEIAGKEQSRIQLDNLLVGDVWLAGGQSNMEKRVEHLIEAEETASTANLFPKIRAFKSSHQMSLMPLNEVGDKSVGWFTCNSQNTMDFVSAVAYIFALNIHLNEQIPVGIIEAYRGGTEIETWISQAKIDSDTGLQRVRERQLQMDPESEDARKNYPSIHFNGQINPFINIPIKGFIFYQGESNTKRGLEYGQMMEALIDDWRTHWGFGDIPFYYVQLFNMGIAGNRIYEESNWADTRDQQFKLLSNNIDNIGKGGSIDTNEDPDNEIDRIRIHPKNKKPIGERLALLAMEHTYGIDTLGTSPFLKSSYVSNDTVFVILENAGKGLGPAKNGENLHGFVIAGDDRNFFHATATVVNDSIIALKSEMVKIPVAARYAWSKNPDCNLVNSTGLPASPFRTDQWPSGFEY